MQHHLGSKARHEGGDAPDREPVAVGDRSEVEPECLATVSRSQQAPRRVTVLAHPIHLYAVPVGDDLILRFEDMPIERHERTEDWIALLRT